MNKKQMVELARSLNNEVYPSRPADFYTTISGILQLISEIIERLPDDEQIETTATAQPSSDA
ncbi:MAG: hypothetical protein JNJ61_04365 [Anaerolineae bacterium]|nr:hypothetical protein [Anaerolineae bacterium]